MTFYVRPSKNFVNLGRFYSIPPWGLQIPSPNTVNLGSLYVSPRFRSPTGFGYFQDGSVFVNPKGYASHAAFEAEMKLLQPFVHGPSPRLYRIRKENPDKGRLLIIAKAKPGSSCTILARNMRDGDKILTKRSSPFKQIKFQLDPQGSYPVSVKFQQKAVALSASHKREIVAALGTFRGTLIDGVLQPNVRLGNGLNLLTSLDISPPLDGQSMNSLGRSKSKLISKYSLSGRMRQSTHLPQMSKLRRAPLIHLSQPNAHIPESRGISEREAEVNRREQQLLMYSAAATHKRTSQHRNGNSAAVRKEIQPFNSHQRSNMPHSPSQAQEGSLTEIKRAEVEARKRELQQKEEILKWKQRSFALQQQLLMARKRVSPQRVEYKGDLKGMSRLKNDSGAAPLEDIDRSIDAKEDHLFSNFDIHDPPPPRSLQRLRTWIKLPKKGT